VSMKPYYEFAKVGRGRVDGIELPDGRAFLMVDYYCTEPGCTCQDVQIEIFAESRQEQFPKEMLASFRMDTVTGDLTDVQADDEQGQGATFVEEFKNGLTPKLQRMFQGRLREAKLHGRETALSLENLRYVPGECVSYAEIYPTVATSSETFDYMGKQYVVDDQYCIDPSCGCNETILTYVELQDYTNESNRFAIRLSLQNAQYLVESYANGTDDEVRAIHRAYMKHVHKDLETFRRRYAKMKEFGSRHVQEVSKEIKRNQPSVKAVSVGRNDPCPCGSGKKYKKCCGI